MESAIDCIKAVDTLERTAAADRSDQWQGDPICQGRRQVQKQEVTAFKARQSATFWRLTDELKPRLTRDRP